MSALDGQDLVQDALLASLTAKLPGRIVTRSLIQPLNTPNADLQKGVVCVVTERGGGFANYRGREADLGKTDVALVCFVMVDEPPTCEPVDIERAELLLLRELLDWVHNPGDRSLLGPVDAIYPGDWACSKQIEFPRGWLVLSLDVR